MGEQLDLFDGPAHEDVGAFLMRWADEQVKEMFAPGERGMWVAWDHSMTWSAVDDGPTHWKPYDARRSN